MDYLVIGAGPAGLQLGHFLQRAGRDHVVLEAEDAPGSYFRTFPRHRKLISINKPHTGWTDPELNLRMDWNSLLSDDPDLRFTRYTEEYFPPADLLVDYFADYAAKTGVQVEYGTRVTSIDRDTEFRVATDLGRTYSAKRIIVATGLARPFIPAIPGIETTESYNEVSVDPRDFTDQRVLILGKGNSAFETADNLVANAALIHVLGPESLRFAWRTHFSGDLRAVNNNFLDTYQLKSQNLVLDATVEKIELRDAEYHVTLRYSRRPKTVTLVYDRVVTCTGFRMDTGIFTDRVRPRLTVNDRFAELTPAWESATVPGLYFAGTLTQVLDRRKFTSSVLHGFRYGVRALHHVLEQRYEGAEWPGEDLPADPDVVAGAILARVNRSSGLWNQFGFLADVLVLNDDGTSRLLEEMPVGLALAERPGAHFVTVTLEYGSGYPEIDPFDVTAGRAWEDDPATESLYMHPVLRRYRDGELVETRHLPEDVANDWTGEAEYRAPVRETVAVR
ncbi:NAD(P)-binding domain-containing protein [Amycolatopsis oliviviridis]|uniref:Pyridine nucleotide-disulfide oxidoreductase n=1 Tax=Amycolatopsis oliviviridis TaxID=1471590 RepID=A0ABQ3MDS7_9PSEU|nr:NAD(P)-binding domain-containing protein [Amycolatopsis oliviviridis]GHH38867.1 pyridine nucleotide-disulfide oxidoreductase [Amycolatopsis oliviviridis]